MLLFITDVLSVCQEQNLSESKDAHAATLLKKRE